MQAIDGHSGISDQWGGWGGESCVGAAFQAVMAAGTAVWVTGVAIAGLAAGGSAVAGGATSAGLNKGPVTS